MVGMYHQSLAAECDLSCPSAVLWAVYAAAAKRLASECESLAADADDQMLVDVPAVCKRDIASFDDEESSPSTTNVSDAEQGASDSDDSESCKEDSSPACDDVSTDASMATSTIRCDASPGLLESNSDDSASCDSCASSDSDVGTSNLDCTLKGSGGDAEVARTDEPCAEAEASRPTAPEAQEQGGTAACDDAHAPSDSAPVPFSMDETVIIFDWDDTILPSTWVQNEYMRLDSDFVLSAWQQEQFAMVAKAAYETLTAAKRFGTVLLITNAESGWIELSCRKFLPTLVPALKGLKVISARTSYEGPDCLEPVSWKIRAFDVELRRIFGPDADSERRKNLLSLGDSVHEREALMRAASTMTNCCAKSMKFRARPAVRDMCRQHALVASCFERIVQHDGTLDLCIRC